MLVLPLSLRLVLPLPVKLVFPLLLRLVGTPTYLHVHADSQCHEVPGLQKLCPTEKKGAEKTTLRQDRKDSKDECGGGCDPIHSLITSPDGEDSVRIVLEIKPGVLAHTLRTCELLVLLVAHAL